MSVFIEIQGKNSKGGNRNINVYVPLVQSDIKVPVTLIFFCFRRKVEAFNLLIIIF